MFFYHQSLYYKDIYHIIYIIYIIVYYINYLFIFRKDGSKHKIEN